MATAAQRSSAARYAVNTSWAYTPNRTERTAPATKASPVSVDYWIKKFTDEGVIRSVDIPAAAENARRAHMQGLARKSAKARAAKKTKPRRKAA